MVTDPPLSPLKTISWLPKCHIACDIHSLLLSLPSSLRIDTDSRKHSSVSISRKGVGFTWIELDSFRIGWPYTVKHKDSLMESIECCQDRRRPLVVWRLTLHSGLVVSVLNCYTSLSWLHFIQKPLEKNMKIQEKGIVFHVYLVKSQSVFIK